MSYKNKNLLEIFRKAESRQICRPIWHLSYLGNPAEEHLQIPISIMESVEEFLQKLLIA